jgi:hypothetical protein
MWPRIQRKRRKALAFGIACAAAIPAFAVAAGALTRLEPGKWMVKPAGGAAHELCLKDPMQLVRLEHPGALCTDDTIHDEISAGTIQYSCPGHGYGHTSFKIETRRSATIDTQGLVDGRPFHYRAVARRVGDC